MKVFTILCMSIANEVKKKERTGCREEEIKLHG